MVAAAAQEDLGLCEFACAPVGNMSAPLSITSTLRTLATRSLSIVDLKVIMCVLLDSCLVSIAGNGLRPSLRDWPIKRSPMWSSNSAHPIAYMGDLQVHGKLHPSVPVIVSPRNVRRPPVAKQP